MARILIVDDEQVMLESLKIGLQVKGYEVITALSGKEALVYFTVGDSRIDLIITDYVMPGMTGIELVGTIRKKFRYLPAMLMTAYGKKKLVVEALRNHLDSYIEKPFTNEELLAEIEKTLKNSADRDDTVNATENIGRYIHQINNPLAVIAGSVELAGSSLDDSTSIRKYLNGISEACKKIREINTKIRASARMSQSSFELINARHALENSLNFMQSLLVSKGIEVEKDLDAADLEISADRFGLEQVFNNLILNAVQAMDGSLEKKLRLKAEMHSEEDRSLLFHVQDTGCGIATESVDRIFTDYYTSKRDGAGLGLSVVKSMVENHGGQIRVVSRLGKGSTFTVTLPCGNCDVE